jgi:ABC-type branched-chain amino acid transport systems, ATPase component
LLQRKRLELARALALNPKLLLLDEIAGGLSEHETHALIGTIRAIHARGTTIVWIEHIVHALVSIASRLIVMNFGQKLAEGVPRAVWRMRGSKKSTWEFRPHELVADPVAAGLLR